MEGKETKATGFRSGKYNPSCKGAINDLGWWVSTHSLL